MATLSHGRKEFNSNFPMCMNESTKISNSSLAAGNFGIERTLSTVRCTMDWPEVAKYVKLLCDSCPVCQKVKPAIVAKRQLHLLPIMSQHFERTAMDIFGPLKRTPRLLL